MFDDGRPNPYAELKKVLALPRRAQRSILLLEVWCENSKCCPIRVFARHPGLLVQCRSDAKVSEAARESYSNLGAWSPRRAFFLHEWLDQPADVLPTSHLQVVCDCRQTTPRLVSVRKLADAMPNDGRTRRLRLPEVAV